MDFFSAPEVIENDEEEIDMFAVLGVVNAQQNSITARQLTPDNSPHMDLLAAFNEDHQVLEPQPENAFVFESGLEEEKEIIQSMPAISEETIAELLEVLVKQELKQRENRGEEWLSELPAQARADIQSAKVIKDQDAYQLSLIIDMGGSVAVRPFASVQSTQDGVKPNNPPSSIPEIWIPLYNVLRDLLVQAMNVLNSTRIGMNFNA
ncbi:MAG: hypothetical protein QF479_03530 [Candidatus Poseidoniaceae archaeon]|nr:hypothetical protein [Candidatus Poseidoniaceae archaeon]